jgi:hypothetical protein
MIIEKESPGAAITDAYPGWVLYDGAENVLGKGRVVVNEVQYFPDVSVRN